MRRNTYNNKVIEMEKGQIFSLVFLISMVVIMAAIGLLIQTTEFNSYNMKEERIHNKMRNVAKISANLIVSSNETTCDDGLGGHLMNCVDSTADFTPITSFLTNSGYEYDIDSAGGAIDMLSGLAWNGQDFVEVKRTTFIDNLSGSAEDLTVRAWKA